MSPLTDFLLGIILQELVIILCLSQKLLNSSKNSASWAFCLEREVNLCQGVCSAQPPWTPLQTTPPGPSPSTGFGTLGYLGAEVRSFNPDLDAGLYAVGQLKMCVGRKSWLGYVRQESVRLLAKVTCAGGRGGK